MKAGHQCDSLVQLIIMALSRSGSQWIRSSFPGRLGVRREYILEKRHQSIPRHHRHTHLHLWAILKNCQHPYCCVFGRWKETWEPTQRSCETLDSQQQELRMEPRPLNAVRWQSFTLYHHATLYFFSFKWNEIIMPIRTTLKRPSTSYSSTKQYS